MNFLTPHPGTCTTYRLRQLMYGFMLVITVVLLPAKARAADLVISEFLASNSGASLVDEDGDSSDWIEIHNTGVSAISLLGYALTDSDDPADLMKWVVPNVTIPADGYLLVFASDKDRAVAGNELHTNFKLSAGGEYLALVDSGGTVLNSYDPTFPEQEEDISYGLGIDGVTYGYFVTPTPGASNSVSVAGRVADTSFSVDRGIYSSSFSVEITTATPGAEIRYTTDGSTPTATRGTIYTVPIFIDKTTVLRAAGFQAGLFPSNVDTQSYLFPADVSSQQPNGSAPPGWPSISINGQVYNYGMDPDIVNRYTAQEFIDALTAIPSAMITTDISNLISARNGIYSNPENHGIAWERPAHLEMFGNGIAEPVNVRCGLRIRGGASRNPSNPKHAFRVFLRDEYGNSSLKNPLFETEGVDEFKKIDFRTAQNYSWSKDGDEGTNTFLRDVLGRDLQGASGEPYTRSRYCHLYLNGIYWGLFMTQERAEANWGESYFGGDDDDFDTIKPIGRSEPNQYQTEATDGDLNGDWAALWQLARDQYANPTTARYNQMQGLDASGVRNPAYPVLLDADNLIHMMLVLGYTGAYDNCLSSFIGATNNFYSVRDSSSDDQGFVHLVHDAEHSLGAGGSRWNNHNDRINTTNGSQQRSFFNRSNPQFLHQDLAESTEAYRQRFADLAHQALFNDGYLTKEKVLEKLEFRRQRIEDAIICESARWGDAKQSDPADKENWESAVQNLENVIETRAATFLSHLRAGDLYPSIDAPEFTPFQDYVPTGTSIAIGGSEGTLYYTTNNIDPRQSNGSPDPSASSFALTSYQVTLDSTWIYSDLGVNRGSSLIVPGHSSYNSFNWKHPDFNDGSWKIGSSILGYGALGNPAAPIATSMGQGTGPSGINPATCYLRNSFTITQASAVADVGGSFLADDGVVIYLNGVEVYRHNMPTGEVLSTTFASSAKNTGNELNNIAFTIDPGLLVDGENVIAVELHQASADSSDLGFALDLTVTLDAATTVTISEPTVLAARILHNGEWSALQYHYYSTGMAPQPGELLFSEVHYHPADPSTSAELAESDNSRDFEFIELTNISNDNLELRGSALTEQVINDHLEGVRFEFAEGFILPPGGKVVVASDVDAFLARYPGTPAGVIGGEFRGNLGNSGEWLQLQNAEGTILASFRYNDTAPWPIEADGSGMSLQLVDLISTVDFSDPEQWMAVALNGSPGVPGPAPFFGLATADGDQDGLSALYEYFSGTSDSASGEADRPKLWQDSASGQLFYQFIRDPEIFGVQWEFRESGNLNVWQHPSITPVLIERTLLSDGRLRETYALDPSAAESGYFRQRIEIE